MKSRGLISQRNWWNDMKTVFHFKLTNDIKKYYIMCAFKVFTEQKNIKKKNMLSYLLNVF